MSDKEFSEWFDSLDIDAQPNYFDASEAWHAGFSEGEKLSRKQTTKEVVQEILKMLDDLTCPPPNAWAINQIVVEKIQKRFEVEDE